MAKKPIKITEVVLRGTALGNDIQEIAGCGREKEG